MQYSTGFTIVELLIVIVVIAILAALSVVSFSSIQNRAYQSAQFAEIAQWKKLSEAYKVENGIECPKNYAFVYGNSVFGTTDFCVMKYEAKNVGGVPTAQAAGTPWVNINQAEAVNVSTSGCSGCRLITNAEWMTIAADALSIKYNWSGREVGVGYIYSGHNDNVPANPIAASSDDTDGYSGTGNSADTGKNQLRTLYLRSGDVVWDMAGNVSEWTAQSIAMNNIGMTGDTAANWRQWNTPGFSYGNLPTTTLPTTVASVPGLSGATSWSSLNGIGQINSNYNDTTTRGIIRGGTWYDTNIAGVMKLWLNWAPTMSGHTNGFRLTK